MTPITTSPRVLRPQSLPEALEALAEAGPDALCVAGGTDWMVREDSKDARPPLVVDLNRIEELRSLEERDGWLEIGAATTFTEIRSNERVREHFPILAEAAATIGGQQIQNRATIGGNMANASPAGDSLPVLLALDAALVIAGADGERRLPYTEFHRGYGKTALRSGDLIVRVRLPLPRPTVAQRFFKVGTREAQAISKVVVALTVDVEAQTFHDARIAAGSVAPTPLRLRDAEKACEAKPANRDSAREVAAIARTGVSPIDDVRSTAAYRSFVLERVVARLLTDVAVRSSRA